MSQRDEDVYKIRLFAAGTGARTHAMLVRRVVLVGGAGHPRGLEAPALKKIAHWGWWLTSRGAPVGTEDNSAPWCRDVVKESTD